MRTCTAAILIVLLSAAFLLGIFLLAPFPIAIFPAIVKSQVYLRQDKDGQLPTATYYWSRLPSVQYYNFFYFNITNPYEVLYNGEKARLVEVGPYSWAETEFKQEIDWRDGGNTVYYKNNKTWVFSPADSCSSCNLEDFLFLPNGAFMSAVYMKNQQNFGKVAKMLLNGLLLLLGESPLRVVTQGGASFESYPDPLISLINSNLTKTLMAFLGNPVPLPSIPAMGFFPLYNHTCDEDYVLKTGKDNTDSLALIQKWANMTNLPWWGDAYSSDITNSGDGTFQKPGLKKSDKLKQFQSFACSCHSTTHLSPGVCLARLKNDRCSEESAPELMSSRTISDYFPTWPCGTNHTYNPQGQGCSKVDCSLSQFWCNNCCNGTHYNSTVFLPPGIIPLRCLPGQNVLAPFAAFLSPPHFLWSPQEVPENMIGLNPNPMIHEPAAFDIQPLTGSTVGGRFRMQLSIPIYNDGSFTETKQLYNSFLPAFWVEIKVKMMDYAHDYIYFNTKELPNIVLGVGIGLVGVSALLGLGWTLLHFRKKRSTVFLSKIEGEDAWSPQ